MNSLRTLATEISISVISVIVVVASCAAQETPQTAVPGGRTGDPAESSKYKGDPQFEQRYPRYELGPNDVLDISFEFTPEFNQTVTVQPDGYISLRGAGDVHAAGLTVPETTEAIRTAYGKILNNPRIAISLKDFNKPYFTVGGAVGRPGKYELRADTTVTEGITIAGGFNDSAKHSQVLLFRRVSPYWMEGKVLDVKKMLNSKNLSEDPSIKPGDMIFVPESLASKIRRYIPVPGVGIGVPIP